MGYRRRGSEILVNTTTEGGQLAPKITQLASGGYVVVWLELFGGFHGQVFDADGNKVGAEFVTAGWHVAALPDGGFATMSGDGQDVFVQIHAPGGAAAGPAFTANTTSGNQNAGSIAALSSGGFVVTWTDYSDIGDSDIRAQRFASDGSRLGAEFVVNDDSVAPGSQMDPEAVGLAGGGFVVTWESGGAIRAQVFSAAGARVGAEFAVSSETRLMEDPQIAALAGGGFIAVWTKNISLAGDENSQGIFVQVFSSTGARVGAEHLIAAEGPASLESLDVAPLATGGAVVTWASNFNTRRDESGTAVKAQVLDSLGNEVGVELIVNRTTAGDQIQPVVSGLPSGDFVIAWADGSQTGGDTDRFAIRSQLYHDVGSIMGGSGYDLLIGTRGGDTILGFAGDDDMASYGGNDSLDGGTGADYMEGGVGHDVYAVDNWGDWIEEYDDEGTDEVRTSLGTRDRVYTLPDNVENLTGTSTAGQGVEGNWLDNVIITGAGNDLILADAGGDDFVSSAGGNDLIYFGKAFTGADRVDGGGGADSLVLQGNYVLTLSATITDVESISLQSGARTSWGDISNNFYDYSIKTVDGNVATGQQLIVNGQSLRSGEDFTFDGAAESNGKFQVFGGYGVDRFTGGEGNDVFVFSDGRWGASDVVNGGDGRDALVITGPNGLTRIEFGANALINMESVSVSTVYTATRDATPSYEFVLHDGNTAAGRTMIVNGSALLNPTQSFSVDGSAELDGQLMLFGGAGRDVLRGGSQADTLHGADNADTLAGGGGADTFRYDSVAESTAAARDHILDFTSGTDKVDLSRIDANNGAAGDQAFSFIGGAAFHNVAGELRAYQSGGSWYVEGDVNGDGTADLVIQLTVGGSTPLVVGDFIL
jgi:serralysin